MAVFIIVFILFFVVFFFFFFFFFFFLVGVGGGRWGSVKCSVVFHLQTNFFFLLTIM